MDNFIIAAALVGLFGVLLLMFFMIDSHLTRLVSRIERIADRLDERTTPDD